jgi:hypothetical protein
VDLLTLVFVDIDAGLEAMTTLLCLVALDPLATKYACVRARSRISSRASHPGPF